MENIALQIAQTWWILFPIAAVLMGVFGTHSRNRRAAERERQQHEIETLRLQLATQNSLHEAARQPAGLTPPPAPSGPTAQ